MLTTKRQARLTSHRHAHVGASVCHLSIESLASSSVALIDRQAARDEHVEVPAVHVGYPGTVVGISVRFRGIAKDLGPHVGLLLDPVSDEAAVAPN